MNNQNKPLWSGFLHFMAIEPDTVSATEKLVASLGALIGISLIAAVSYQFTGAAGTALIVPSMGASAVLLFAVPHGKLSQPWALIGGNLVSALVGVSCYKLVPEPYLAGGLAVGCSIGVMHLLGCIHPPGGASALVAVVGGPAIHQLGYGYVLTPIALNVAIIFIVAVVFNSFFPWRRYPAAAMMRFTESRPPGAASQAHVIDREAIEKALENMDLVVDVTTEDLQRLMQLSLIHASEQHLTAGQIQLDHFYSNGKHGPEWQVRRIIDQAQADDPANDMVIYRIVEGQGFNSADSCTRQDFALWAAREVFPNE